MCVNKQVMQELINNVKEWVKLDDEVQQLKTEEDKRRQP